MAKTVAAFAGNAWPMLASYVGGLGAFITGSNTVSDLLFAEFQWGVAQQLELPRQIIVAACGAGGAMGNMVCIHNIVAVCAVDRPHRPRRHDPEAHLLAFRALRYRRGHHRQLDVLRVPAAFVLG